MASSARKTTARELPRLSYTNGVGIGQLEVQWGQPASKIKEWIADDLLTPNEDGTIPNSEVRRFNREHGDLLV